jgi:hypothetical protein
MGLIAPSRKREMAGFRGLASGAPPPSASCTAPPACPPPPTLPRCRKRWLASAATHPIRKRRAATLALLRGLLAPIPDDIRGLRDRALPLVGFVGALCRSELAGILRADLERTDQGYELTLKRTKGVADRSSAGPPALWLLAQTAPDAPPALPAIGNKPLTQRSIARIVQGRAAAAGFAPREFAGHSLKRGALSTGMHAGAHAAQFKRLGRHKSFDVLGEYLEFGNLFEGHPLRDLL